MDTGDSCGGVKWLGSEAEFKQLSDEMKYEWSFPSSHSLHGMYKGNFACYIYSQIDTLLCCVRYYQCS